MFACDPARRATTPCIEMGRSWASHEARIAGTQQSLKFQGTIEETSIARAKWPQFFMSDLVDLLQVNSSNASERFAAHWGSLGRPRAELSVPAHEQAASCRDR